MNIPTQAENPNGLYRRYTVTKADGTPVDDDAEYFVLRLDWGGDDQRHIAACRKAVLFYADLIADHLPGLARDLYKRYSVPKTEPQYYRCGWCGQPTDENGRCLSKEDIPKGTFDDWNKAIPTNGECCPNGAD